MKLGVEVVKISAMHKENGDFAGISVEAHAPRDVVIATLKLALLQIEQLSPDAHGTIVVKHDEARKDSLLKRGLN
jgi:hypothetical protein